MGAWDIDRYKNTLDDEQGYYNLKLLSASKNFNTCNTAFKRSVLRDAFGTESI